MLRRILLALGALSVLFGSFDAAYAARPIAAIQADIAVTTAQLSVAQAAAAQTAAAIPPINAKLATLQAELAAAMVTISPNGTTATPGLGQITDQNGTFWIVKADGKIYRTPKGGAQAVVSSSQNVIQLVMVYADGPGLRQQAKDLRWWTQPLDGSAGTLTTAPGTQPPIPPNPGTAAGPITGWTTIQFHDTFKDLSAWTRTFPGKAVTDPYAYGYGARGIQPNGYTMDPWFVCNPQGYPPAAGMEDPVKLQTGGGVQLNGFTNPRWATGQFKTPPAPADMGKWCGSWLWTKATLSPGVEITVTFTVNPWANGASWGSWPAIWLISPTDWSEIDIMDGLMGNPSYPGRYWYAAGAVSGWNMCNGSCPSDGVVKPGKNTVSLKFANNQLIFMLNGVVLKTMAQPNAFTSPLYLGIQEVNGGWDNNNNIPKMAPRTATVYNEVTIYAP